MAGHSKWANIKHKKAATDSKRAKIFTKVAKDIVIAARQGGGDPEQNPSLRLVLAKARAANMPNKNIERAVKRGTGELEGGELLEILYEGYAPHGVGLIIEVISDNRNRAVADVRHVLNKYGGSLGAGGSVAWQFQRKGVFMIPRANFEEEDDLFLVAADAGADDIEFGDPTEVYCAMEDFNTVQVALNEAGIEFEEANLIYDAENTVELDTSQALQVMRVIDFLEDLDDVQNVFSTLEITDEAIEAMSG